MAENITISNNESPLGIIGNDQRREHLQITELHRYNPEHEYNDGKSEYQGFGNYDKPDAGNQTDYLTGFPIGEGHGYDSMDFDNVEVSGCDIGARRAMMNRCLFNENRPYQAPDTTAARAAGLYDTSRPFSRISYTCPIGI